MGFSNQKTRNVLDVLETEINRTKNQEQRLALLEMHYFLTKNASKNFFNNDMLKRLTLFQCECFKTHNESNDLKVKLANKIKDLCKNVR